MGSSIGRMFRVTTYGESHGEALGCVIENGPAGLPLTEADIQPDLDRRRPGQSRITTPRDEADKARILKEIGKDESKVDITRFKGLGEMMPKVLWETTLSPKTRRLLKVEIADALQTDRIISDLMGKDPSARFQFIMEHAEDAQEIDV